MIKGINDLKIHGTQGNMGWNQHGMVDGGWWKREEGRGKRGRGGEGRGTYLGRYVCTCMWEEGKGSELGQGG